MVIPGGSPYALAVEAIAHWVAAGIDAQRAVRLESVEFRIADLPGRYLGLAAAGTVWVDQDAAGHGWDLGYESGPDHALDSNAFTAQSWLTALPAPAGSNTLTTVSEEGCLAVRHTALLLFRLCDAQIAADGNKSVALETDATHILGLGQEIAHRAWRAPRVQHEDVHATGLH